MVRAMLLGQLAFRCYQAIAETTITGAFRNKNNNRNKMIVTAQPLPPCTWAIKLSSGRGGRCDHGNIASLSAASHRYSVMTPGRGLHPCESRMPWRRSACVTFYFVSAAATSISDSRIALYFSTSSGVLCAAMHAFISFSWPLHDHTTMSPASLEHSTKFDTNWSHFFRARLWISPLSFCSGNGAA